MSAMVVLLLAATLYVAEPDPMPVAASAPGYPEIALKAHSSGIQQVLVIVAPDGSVVSAHLLEPRLSLGLEYQAWEAARAWRFAPTGESCDRVALLSFEFRFQVLPLRTEPTECLVDSPTVTYFPPYAMRVVGAIHPDILTVTTP